MRDHVTNMPNMPFFIGMCFQLHGAEEQIKVKIQESPLNEEHQPGKAFMEIIVR